MKRTMTILLATSLALTSWPGQSVALDPCDTEPSPAPWQSLIEKGGLSETTSNALPDFLDKAQALVGDRYVDAWGILDDAGLEHVEFAVVKMSESDQTALNGLAQEFPDLAGKIDIIEAPLSRAALTENLDKVEAALLSGSLEEAASQEVTSLSLRADIGRVEIHTRFPDTSQLASEVMAAVPGCTISFAVGDVANVTIISRNDMPPYKGGKVQQIPFSGEPEPATCETGFVFEGDGAGQGPLWVSTAGHCSQADQTERPVYAGNSIVVQVGKTSLPNIFRQTSPAKGDAVFWQSVPPYSRTDYQNRIILNSSSQLDVTSKLAATSVIIGLSVCVASKNYDNVCGTVTSGYQTILQEVRYRDCLNHQFLFKDITHVACTNIPLKGGDSGAPVYQNVSGNARAVGLVSTAIEQAGESIGSCFTPVTYIGARMGAHVWFGD